MLRGFDGFLKIISAVFEVLSQLLLLIMVGIITWLVISRQVLGHASSWAEEVSLVMIIWFGLIGATFGVRDRYHLRVDLLFKALPRGLRRAIAYCVDFLVVAMGALFIFGGAQHVLLALHQALPATQIPAAARYLPLPIAGALILLYGVRHLIGGGTTADADAADQPVCAPEP